MDQQVSPDYLQIFKNIYNAIFNIGINETALYVLTVVFALIIACIIIYTKRDLPKKYKTMGWLGIILLGIIGTWFGLLAAVSSIESLTGVQMCKVIAFMGDFRVGLASITFGAITYERARQLKLKEGKPTFYIFRRLLIVVFVASTPSAFSTFYTNGKCQMNPIFEYITVTALVESCRFILFHLAVGGYMILQAISKELRLKMGKLDNCKQEQSPATEAMEIALQLEKIRQFHTICLIFGIFWIIFGLCQSSYKVLQTSQHATFPSFSLLPYLVLTVVGLILAVIICKEEKKAVKKRNASRSDDMRMTRLRVNQASFSRISTINNSPEVVCDETESNVIFEKCTPRPKMSDKAQKGLQK